MLTMNNLFGFVMVMMVMGVMVLGTTLAPYRGVISLMVVSFFCCIFMVMLGRTFAALMMYVVYLGGLVVVFGYCVSVESGGRGVFESKGLKYFFVLLVVGLGLYMYWVLVAGFGGLPLYLNWGDMVCMEINGVGVLYYIGGAGLMICSWGLLVVLFSILIILDWGRLGGLRSF